ncbi:MAG: hypothetical protein COV38_09085 [Bdellovibrionales bacterium CG11_big_fil_rev_8_21_14_0_20_38_13]|nr:MAG: hypothetical protein COW79_02790 [Bdellovibrionales bacterium CG22_combo_CG10-13_8_21_14_all_38_13]PIR29746.1 MAG: hypothetical protein COV38_09085 [Bdellovibrionales bacterium CG11_big_fil_rev_8_21_14_0_20_38_13]
MNDWGEVFVTKMDYVEILSMLKKHPFILAAMTSIISVVFFYFGQNYYLDNYTGHEWHYNRFYQSNVGMARETVQGVQGVIEFIKNCNKFPHDFEFRLRSKDCTGKNLRENSDFSRNPRFVNWNQLPWIDPWGRPYQLRYDRERKKLQLRSQGRYLWTSLDDIQAETNLAVPTDLVEPERQKCDQGQDCIFNRGWH